ncbi:MAG: type II toxin-antitoxin system RelE/ParE family toxin [Aquificae bacterium]|jgi:mRNA interferase RelE/StbE|nr:type II toxin-antitoxin system RelE/ParE family toxin [Aquificota bacterium]
MRKFGIKYHPKVKEDIKKLDKETKERIKKAIEEKLTKAPEIFGERLKGTLKDLWKLKVGSYRVVFILDENTVFIVGIWHRKEAYKKITVEDLLKRLTG